MIVGDVVGEFGQARFELQLDCSRRAVPLFTDDHLSGSGNALHFGLPFEMLRRAGARFLALLPYAVK